MNKGVHLLQDNASAHKSRIALKAIECGFELLTHPPYSPDLAPSDCHLFPCMNKQLRGHKFKYGDETKHAVRKVQEEFPAHFLKEGLEALKKRSEKCVTLDGNFVEK